MGFIKDMPIAGIVVIIAIVILFAAALLTLLGVCASYRRAQRGVTGRGRDGRSGGFAGEVLSDFTSAYAQNGPSTNTPAIIDNVMGSVMRRELLGERFLNNSVSLFVTLGLFGTFLGLTMSVSSLSELISLNSGEEWLSLLDSVGGGLMSALSGMGVAFYTSLVGVVCSIIMTAMRSIYNPQAMREQLSAMTELWLDHEVAPTLPTDYAANDEMMVKQLKDELRLHADTVRRSLDEATRQMQYALTITTNSLAEVMESAEKPLGEFDQTVSRFSQNVRDFSEFNHNLRTNIERMDVNFARVSDQLRTVSDKLEGRG